MTTLKERKTNLDSILNVGKSLFSQVGHCRLGRGKENPTLIKTAAIIGFRSSTQPTPDPLRIIFSLAETIVKVEKILDLFVGFVVS